MNINDLSTLLRSSKGYLNFNTSTQRMEVKGSHFLGRFAVWIRYKTSSSYRHSVAQAAQQLIDTMKLDHSYSTPFNQRISQGTPEFLRGEKPISARQVYRFIVDIGSDVAISRASNPQAERSAAVATPVKGEVVEQWISKLVGKDGTEDSRREFNLRLHKMLDDKIKDEPGLNKRNIPTDNIAEEVYTEALDKSTEIYNKADADQLIDTLLSGSLNKHIAHARIQLQERLQEHLSELELPSSIRSEIETEITDMKIADLSQLDQRVIALFLAKTDSSFDDLLKETADKYKFDKAMLATPEIKAQLLQNLKSQLTVYAKDDKLSMELVHSEAVKQLNQQRLGLVHTWVQRWSGCSEGRGMEFFRDELHKSLTTAGIKEVPALEIGKKVAKEILEDPKYVAAIESENDAKAIVLDKLQVFLKPRIEQVRLESRRKLHERLRQADLSDDEHRYLDDEISAARIKTMEQLNLKIKDLVVKRIDSEFEGLFAQVKRGYRFNEEVALTTVRAQLHEKIAALDAHRMVSIGTVRGQAVKLLEQWLSVKMDALEAIKSNRFYEAPLKRLVLQEPYVTKDQVVEFQQAAERTRDEAYEKYTNSYEAQAIKPEALFSKFEQAENREALYGRLSTLVLQAEKPASVFDNEVWHASDIDTSMREHITDVVGPTLDSYRRVEHLSGLVPNFIYQAAGKAVTEQAKIWNEDFVADINGLYINTLKDNNNAALYELLESPEIVQQNIGSKPDNTPFTFGDLVESGIKKDASIGDTKARHKAIDRLIPAEKKDYLLKGIAHDLSQTRDKVMSKTAVGKLFADSVLNALQNANIDFERKEINFQLQTPTTPHYETTV